MTIRLSSAALLEPYADQFVDAVMCGETLAQTDSSAVCVRRPGCAEDAGLWGAGHWHMDALVAQVKRQAVKRGYITVLHSTLPPAGDGRQHSGNTRKGSCDV
jgi:hypothetical protein